MYGGGAGTGTTSLRQEDLEALLPMLAEGITQPEDELVHKGLAMLAGKAEEWTADSTARKQLAAVAGALAYAFELEGKRDDAAESEWIRWALLRNNEDIRRFVSPPLPPRVAAGPQSLYSVSQQLLCRVWSA